MFGLWNKKNKHIDIDVLRQKAKENDVNAQYELSLAYYRGVYVAKNIEKSNYWFEKANETNKSLGV
jgi:TPR repeat protein